MRWMTSLPIGRSKVAYQGTLSMDSYIISPIGVHALSKLQPLLYGLTQGSVLGLLLFNMYTADISKVVESHGHKLHQYADNCHVYVTVPVSESASAVDHFSHCRRRVKVGELQPPSSQPGEDARHLVRRKTASYERRGRQRPRAIIDSYNGGQCT